MKYAFFALAVLASTPALTGQTFTAKGQYLATIMTGDGQPLTQTEAEQTAELLNARHNNGVNPVEARLYCD